MSETLSIAVDYQRRGWQPLPIPTGAKAPVINGWQNFKTTDAELSKYFNGARQNIGVLLGKSSGNLVDVDLDSPETIALAKFFLPKTGAIFGRASKPNSHFLYVCDIPKIKTFDDPLLVKSKDKSEAEKARLVELRSNGGQTVFPGSVHPSGEKIVWHLFDEPTEVAPAELQKAVARLASAALLTRYWREKTRHNLSRALSGMLLRNGFDEAETAHFIKAICFAAGDDEVSDRVATVRTTAERLKRKEECEGIPTLIELTDKKIVDALCKWLEIKPSEQKAPENKQTTVEHKEIAEDKPLKLVCFANVQTEPISWLWFPYIALGKLTIIEGEEGLGKSWLTCAFAAAVSTGAGFPPNFDKIEPANVLMLSAEDGLADTIKPRLVSCGADTSKVFAPDEVFAFDEKGLLRLEMYINETAPALVTIDPLFAYTPAKTDINSANQSRSIAAPLAQIAAKHKCAMSLVRHIGKSKGNGDARSAGLGSIDWRAAVRSVLLVGKDPDNEQNRAIVQTKNNLAAHGDAIGYLIESSLRGAVLRWTGKSTLTKECILASVKDEDARADKNHTVGFLREILRDGAKPAKEIKKQAFDKGMTEQNLRTARNSLKILVFKEGGTFGGNPQWLWKLPEDVAEDVSNTTEDVSKPNNQHLQQNHSNKTSYVNGLAEDVSCYPNQHLQSGNQHLQSAENGESEVFEI